MCAHQHPIHARPGRDYNPPESTCYVTSAVDEAVLIQIWFKRAWFKSASLCYLTGHLLRLGTVINIWLRHHLFAWFHMFRCIFIERWIRYWLCGTQNGSIRYAHFIDGIPEISIPAQSPRKQIQWLLVSAWNFALHNWILLKDHQVM